MINSCVHMERKIDISDYKHCLLKVVRKHDMMLFQCKGGKRRGRKRKRAGRPTKKDVEVMGSVLRDIGRE